MSKDKSFGEFVEEQKAAAIGEMMDGVALMVSVVNGIKAGLVNEGWDPRRAERLVVVEWEKNALPSTSCRSCGNDPTGEPFK